MASAVTAANVKIRVRMCPSSKISCSTASRNEAPPSRNRGRRRKRLVRVDDEHDERVQVGRTAAGHLHRHTGTSTRFALPRFHALHTVGAANALFAGEHEESLRAGMTVDVRYAA